MRRIMMVLAAAIAVNSITLAPPRASAAPVGKVSAAQAGAVSRVQYWEPRPYDGGWERRQQWREWRRERDEARIAETARREAWRIEQEREQRRAWRQDHGYGPGYNRGW
jgi:hypothetical protein